MVAMVMVLLVFLLLALENRCNILLGSTSNYHFLEREDGPLKQFFWYKRSRSPVLVLVCPNLLLILFLIKGCEGIRLPKVQLGIEGYHCPCP